MNCGPATARVLEVLGSNDLLPFEVVAVRRPIVVTGTRWNHGSLGMLGRPEQCCGASPLRKRTDGFRNPRAVTCSVKNGKAGHAAG